MDMNFTKAHDFTINGGNFGTVNGGVNNITLTPNAQSPFAGLGLGSIAAGLLPAPPSQGSGLGAGASIHSVPSTPGATNPANLSPPSSTTSTSSPASTSSGSDGDSSSLRPPATPPTTGMGEHRHPGASSYRPPPAQQHSDLLTPLTDALELRRFTPYETPQEIDAEFPGTPQSMNPLPTSPPERRTPPYHQAPAPPFTPRLPQNAQLMNQSPQSTLPPSPTDFSVHRASSISPTGSSAATQTIHSPSVPPYLRNSPPSFYSSAPMSPRTGVMPQGPTDLEDPSAIFQRLRADTKGYANRLPHSNVLEYSPSPSLSARPNLPHQAELPQVDRVPEFATPRSSRHWTPNVISDWTNDVREGDYDTRPVHDYQSVPQQRVPRPLPSPPAHQPQVPINSFSFPQHSQQYPIHADTYHAPPHRQPQYQDNQSWPIFAPTMHAPPPFPPSHYPTYQNRSHYNQQQPAYPSAYNHGNAPNFPMPLMG
ncbi:hypothetical protein Agabi119p4_10054 [Agaricus bisporus var. burnettii]|uniref:Uncharacterized protein n=1 Tax=Agaricus bisporus var. burnettii TaxID=192524 RepID=A0A8H7EWK7_AGABI|nr:hypothetical protein Agabi119p4_10054 [Agaricus bisporus var. burnettii]